MVEGSLLHETAADEDEPISSIALQVFSTNDGSSSTTGPRRSRSSRSRQSPYSGVGYAPVGAADDDDIFGKDGFIDYDSQDEDVTVYEASEYSLSSNDPEVQMEILQYDGEESGDGPVAFLLQAVPTLVIAGLGLVAAGLVLDMVQHWAVFETISEFFILVPPLLGLKGNLEMTLAARLSTAANLGVLDKPNERKSLIIASLALVQVQAVGVAAVAALTAILLGVIVHHNFELSESLIIVSCSIATTMICGLVLGSIMAGIVVLSRQYDVNPDNIATPIAASMGDLITLLVLVYLSKAAFNIPSEIQTWLLPLLIFLMVASAPFFFVIANRHEAVAPILRSGWSPIIIAMVISSLGGLVLERQVGILRGFGRSCPRHERCRWKRSCNLRMQTHHRHPQH